MFKNVEDVVEAFSVKLETVPGSIHKDPEPYPLGLGLTVRNDFRDVGWISARKAV